MHAPATTKYNETAENDKKMMPIMCITLSFFLSHETKSLPAMPIKWQIYIINKCDIKTIQMKEIQR